MERRYFSRTPVSRGALITYPQGQRYACQIINMSTDGMFISTDACELHKGSIVEVTVSARFPNLEPIIVVGFIVHDSQNGVGLMFDEEKLLYRFF